jgi:hypothetical protein
MDRRLLILIVLAVLLPSLAYGIGYWILHNDPMVEMGRALPPGVSLDTRFAVSWPARAGDIMSVRQKLAELGAAPVNGKPFTAAGKPILFIKATWPEFASPANARRGVDFHKIRDNETLEIQRLQGQYEVVVMYPADAAP